MNVGPSPSSADIQISPLILIESPRIEFSEELVSKSKAKVTSLKNLHLHAPPPDVANLYFGLVDAKNVVESISSSIRYKEFGKSAT